MAGRLYACAHSGYLMTEARHIQAKADLVHAGSSDCDDFDNVKKGGLYGSAGGVMCTLISSQFVDILVVPEMLIPE